MFHVLVTSSAHVSRTCLLDRSTHIRMLAESFFDYLVSDIFLGAFIRAELACFCQLS